MLSHLTSLQPYYCVPDCSGILNCTPKIISDILNTSTVFCIFFYFFVLYAKLQLILQYFSYFCNCLIYSCRILTACLCHVRSSAATAADKCCDSFDQISCMCAFLHGCVCCHCDQIDFSVLFRCQNNNTFSDLFLELVAQIAQTVHVYIFHTCCKKLYSGSFL